MVMRLNIGKAPTYGPGEIQPVGFQLGDEIDPFAGQAPGRPSGSAAQAAPPGLSLGDEIDLSAELAPRGFAGGAPASPAAIAVPSPPPAPAPDPFTAALTGPTRSMYSQGTQPSAAWRDEPGFFPGLFGQGTSRLVPSEEPAPEPVPMGSRTGTPPDQPAPLTGLLDFGAQATRSYLGADQIMPNTAGFADRAAQMIDAAPVGTGRTPDLDPRGPGAVAARRAQVEATPYQPVRGDGTSLTAPTPGVVAYEPSSGDQFGGEVSNMALAQASLIPLTSQENLQKRIMIYAQDLGVPPDRFFTDKADPSQIKYVDFSGQTFSVAPTVSGGSWRAPVDLASRAVTQSANNAGPAAVHAVGTAAGMLTGPEMYGPAAMASSALFGGAADAAAQVAGNKFAEMSGYRPQVQSDQPDIDFYHVLGTAATHAGGEAFARVVPAVLARTGFERLFGANPFRLSGADAQDLARVIEDDVINGGSILRRAQVAAELGLPLSPATLLQVTRGVGGSSADMVNTRNRLFNILSQKENTLASLSGKRGGEASQFLREHYTHWERDLFPRAVGQVVDRISPVESPTLGFQMFKQAADTVLGHLRRQPLEAGHRNGWGSLFSSAQTANARPVIDLVDQRLGKAAGSVRAELQRLRGELTDGGQPVTDIERLHGVRLLVERRLAELRQPGKSSDEAVELANELDGIRDMLRAQLNQNPLYFTGDRAFSQAKAGVDDAERGILSLLRVDPRFQERLGGPLADSGPTTIAAARRLFEEAGQTDAWNAHTRAYLETHLRGVGAKGQGAGLSFANEVASQPKLHAGLMEMVPGRQERELLEGLIDAGFAMDQRREGMKLFTQHSVKPDPRSLNPESWRLGEKAAAFLTPVQSLTRRAADGQLRRDTRGARDMAFEMSMPALKNYQEMTHTVVPLAGHRGEVFERGLHAVSPSFDQATDLIPRTSPKWLLEQLAPLLNPPPERDPTAPDLAPAARARMWGLLGPAPH